MGGAVAVPVLAAAAGEGTAGVAGDGAREAVGDGDGAASDHQRLCRSKQMKDTNCTTSTIHRLPRAPAQLVEVPAHRYRIVSLTMLSWRWNTQGTGYVCVYDSLNATTTPIFCYTFGDADLPGLEAAPWTLAQVIDAPVPLAGTPFLNPPSNPSTRLYICWAMNSVTPRGGGTDPMTIFRESARNETIYWYNGDLRIQMGTPYMAAGAAGDSHPEVYFSYEEYPFPTLHALCNETRSNECEQSYLISCNGTEVNESVLCNDGCRTQGGPDRCYVQWEIGSKCSEASCINVTHLVPCAAGAAEAMEVCGFGCSENRCLLESEVGASCSTPGAYDCMDSSTLIGCDSGSKVNSSEVCSLGCKSIVGSSDRCFVDLEAGSSCSFDKQCGTGEEPRKLYTCSAGTISSTFEMCRAGCETISAGADRCYVPHSLQSQCVGDVCDGDTLVECSPEGRVSSRTPCANGCDRARCMDVGATCQKDTCTRTGEKLALCSSGTSTFGSLQDCSNGCVRISGTSNNDVCATGTAQVANNTGDPPSPSSSESSDNTVSTVVPVTVVSVFLVVAVIVIVVLVVLFVVKRRSGGVGKDAQEVQLDEVDAQKVTEEKPGKKEAQKDDKKDDK